MFGWGKKKPTKDELLKAKLQESLAKYAAEQEDTTDTTFTDVEIEGKKLRVPKINAKALEELTLTEFEHEVTVVGLDHNKDKDPWSVNPADTTQWHRARKHGK